MKILDIFNYKKRQKIRQVNNILDNVVCIKCKGAFSKYLGFSVYRIRERSGIKESIAWVRCPHCKGTGIEP